MHVFVCSVCEPQRRGEGQAKLQQCGHVAGRVTGQEIQPHIPEWIRGLDRGRGTCYSCKIMKESYMIVK